MKIEELLLSEEDKDRIQEEICKRYKTTWVGMCDGALRPVDLEQLVIDIFDEVAKAQLLKLADPKYRIMVEVEGELPDTTLCDCGHPRTAHFKKEGQCDGCGCTWYSPNIGVVDMLKAGYRKVIPLSEWLEGKEAKE